MEHGLLARVRQLEDDAGAERGRSAGRGRAEDVACLIDQEPAIGRGSVGAAVHRTEVVEDDEFARRRQLEDQALSGRSACLIRAVEVTRRIQGQRGGWTDELRTIDGSASRAEVMKHRLRARRSDLEDDAAAGRASLRSRAVEVARLVNDERADRAVAIVAMAGDGAEIVKDSLAAGGIQLEQGAAVELAAARRHAEQIARLVPDEAANHGGATVRAGGSHAKYIKNTEFPARGVRRRGARHEQQAEECRKPGSGEAAPKPSVRRNCRSHDRFPEGAMTHNARNRLSRNTRFASPENSPAAGMGVEPGE